MYDILASYYDEFQDMDYESLADYYERLFSHFGISPKLMLDLGCGTGNVTLALAKRGYDMIGLDASEQMLHAAAEKARNEKQDILFLCQDMADFELYGTVDAMVCALDGVNYLTEDGDFERMLQKLAYYLNPGGLLIFDINTPYKFEKILDGRSFVYEDEDACCIWNSELDKEEQLCYFDLTFFVKEKDGRYVRLEESQTERVYTQEELTEKITRCSLKTEGVFHDRTLDAPKETSERLFFVVRREK